MSITLMVLLIESSLVLFAIVGLLFFMGWKKKKKQTATFEKLLNNIKKIEGERKIQLAQFLMNNHALSEQDAKESAEYMVESEKQFLEQFIKQQMQQQPITDFYSDLCGLLDQYLSFIPNVKIAEVKQNKPEAIESTDKVEDETAWGEAFSESNDSTEEPESNEAPPSLSESPDNKVTEKEPDWSDAFSESGDTIKASESSEQDK